MWRDFPDRVASATGCGALVYSRLGYGSSDPVRGPRSVRFMHEEGLEVLPAVVEHFGLQNILLYGHSDGASIALIFTGMACSAAAAIARRVPVTALVLEAPHVFVEPVCIERIARLAGDYETTRLRERLMRYHGGNTDSMFRSWTEVWLTPEFRQWNIEQSLPPIDAPVLVIQGEDDDYGTLRQVESVVAQVRGPAESLVLPRCGHSPHTDQPEKVLEGSSRFLRQALAPRRG